MARNFRNQSKGSNLFAFQDIITAVIGIFLLMILFLIVSMNSVIPVFASATERTPGLLPEPAEKAPPDLQLRLDEMLGHLAGINEENRRLQQALAEAEAIGDVELLEGMLTDLRRRLAEAETELSRMNAGLEEAGRRAHARAAELGQAGLQEQVDSLRTEIAEKQKALTKMERRTSVLERQVRLAQSRLLEEMHNRDQIWIIPELTRTTKEPVIFVVSRNEVTRHRFNYPDSDLIFPTSEIAREFQRAVADLQPTDHYLVFFFRPSGIGLFDEILSLGRDRRFEIGYDAVEEDLVIHFSSGTSGL